MSSPGNDKDHISTVIEIFLALIIFLRLFPVGVTAHTIGNVTDPFLTVLLDHFLLVVAVITGV